PSLIMAARSTVNSPRMWALRQSSAAAAAVRIAFARSKDGLTDEHAAIAKIITGDAVPVAASIGHALHGAIGMSEEHVLHLFTGNLRQWRLEYGSPSYWADRLGEA